MNKKEKWAEEVLQSLTGINKAVPNPDLFAKITLRLQADKQTNIIPLHQLRWVSVAACVVVALNIYAITMRAKSVNEQVTKESAQYILINEYTLYK
jgi:hypothetical protein